jgi:circadian clock protein KaiB
MTEMAQEDDPRDSLLAVERALARGLRYELYLYVAGTTSHSVRAIRALKDICVTSFGDRCELHIVDIYESPELAREAQIIAVPALVRKAPSPVRKLVGDLADRARVLRFLELPATAKDGAV